MTNNKHVDNVMSASAARRALPLAVRRGMLRRQRVLMKREAASIGHPLYQKPEAAKRNAGPARRNVAASIAAAGRRNHLSCGNILSITAYAASKQIT